MSVLHNRAERLLDAGKFIQARAAFVALHVEDLSAARFGLGRVCLAQHRFVRAETHFWEALRHRPNWFGIRNWLSACRLGRGDVQTALMLADSALASGAAGPLNSLCRGRALCAIGELTAAASCLEPALERFPENLELQLALIRVRWDQGDHVAQLEILATLMKQHPGHAPGWEMSAILLLEAGQIERAEQVLRTAVAADPSEASLQFLFAELLLRTDRLDELGERMAFLEVLAELNAELLLELGALYAELGDPDTAMARFMAALEVEPEHPEALYRIGGYAEAAGEMAAALNFYQRAVGRDPHHRAAIARLDVLPGSETPEYNSAS